jgi:hypothetical protein
MPVIHREAGLVFRFFSNENKEEPHIHAYGQKGSMKVWLSSLEIAKIRKLPANDQKRALEIIERNQEKFLYEWFEFKKREAN